MPLSKSRLFIFVLPQFDPVAPFRLFEVRPTDHILEDAPVFFDRPDRPDVVVVAGHEYAMQATFVMGDLQSLTKNLGRVALPTKFGHHDVADVPTYPFEKLIE